MSMGNVYRAIAAIATAAAIAAAIWAFADLAGLSVTPDRRDIAARTGAGELRAEGAETAQTLETASDTLSPSYELVEAALDIATKPDSGPSGYVVRWPDDHITVYVAGDGWDPQMRNHVDAALAWVQDATGLEIEPVETETDANIVINPRERGGGRATAEAYEGRLHKAWLEIGCCKSRVAYEEIGQAMGAFGDHGPRGSVFSQDLSAQYPSEFDTWVLRSIYKLQPGASRSELEVVLKAALP